MSQFLVDRLNFPSLLPTGCLLGYVDVVDCLGQEEYREQFPDGESDSPFVFICTHPQELLVKFPMSGQHKICNSFLLHIRVQTKLLYQVELNLTMDKFSYNLTSFKAHPFACLSKWKYAWIKQNLIISRRKFYITNQFSL